jgi:hypothetical protein
MADALQDAGIDSADVLGHCRGREARTRGLTPGYRRGGGLRPVGCRTQGRARAGPATGNITRPHSGPGGR